MPSRRFKADSLAAPRPYAGLVAGTAVLVGIVASIVFSPLALQLLDGNDRDWERLSLIGQSYGAISALLAAAAVVGVALTLLLQQRQIRDSRRLAIRQFHMNLLVMAIDNPELLRAWGDFPQPGGTEARLTVYTNLVMNYFVLLRETGTANMDEIRFHLRLMSNSEWARKYWESTADAWTTAYSGRAGQIVTVFGE